MDTHYKGTYDFGEGVYSRRIFCNRASPSQQSIYEGFGGSGIKVCNVNRLRESRRTFALIH